MKEQLWIQPTKASSLTLPERLRRWAEITDVPGRAARLRELADRYEADGTDDADGVLGTYDEKDESDIPF